MIPTTINLNSSITLRPLSQQLENGVLIIGRKDQFLELPPEGRDFLAWLEEGFSLEAARQRYEAEFNPFPADDLQEVMQAFLEADFIAAVDGHPITPQHDSVKDDRVWIPQSLAERLYATPMLLLWLTIVLPAVGLWVATPDLWPRYQDYFWLEYNFLIILIGLLTWLVWMAVHEASHLLAARAKGIHATITWTQRLGVFPMSQTIMHDIWAIPRANRLLPLAAGMMTDWLHLSLVLYLLLADGYGLLMLPPLLIGFLKYLLLTGTMALTSQFLLFSKMDGYFLLSSLLGQRNLQADTLAWFKSKIGWSKQFRPSTGGVTVIYIYAGLMVVWGGLFMGQVAFVDIPIRLRLIWESLLKLMTGSEQPLDFADGVGTITSQGIDIMLLIYVYLRGRLTR